MQNIQHLRDKINTLDVKILAILAKRREITQKIGEIKKNEALPIIDKQREWEISKLRSLEAKKLDIPIQLANNIFKLIITDSRQLQKKSHML